jgi:hypothetical protein
MIVLIITACQIAHPHVCQNFEVPLTIDKVNQGLCMMIGQMEAAKPGGWIDQNKGWRVAAYKCATPATNFKPKERGA